MKFSRLFSKHEKLMNNRRANHTEEILIVDDTPANLRLLSQMLAERGYTIRAATGGHRALESIYANPPNLILLDIKMPDMDGYEVTKQLKDNKLTRDIPIIFISALNEIDDKVRGFDVGGVDYITKPFQFEEVLARVETHLALRELQKQLQDANDRFESELALAGNLQASFFRNEPPAIPGWSLAVSLKPARETSGDFYDVYPLPNGSYGVLVADVVDKGAAAALYMALSWTLIRTYATQYPSQPEKVISKVNQRIISDTDASRFVTVFYGVLDPASGQMVYVNAGHNPPCLIRSNNKNTEEWLTKTGLLLGMFGDEDWTQGSIQIDPGDVLVLYTDGVTEAQNGAGEFFGTDGLLDVARSYLQSGANTIKEKLLKRIAEFLGTAAQHDDIALVIVTREVT